MNKKIKKRWLEALRSGKYKQGRGWLREGDTYCCLGVLCDLFRRSRAGKETNAEWYESVLGSDEGEANGVLSNFVCEWAGLDSPDPVIPGTERTLSDYNDGDAGFKPRSFKQIAQLIEKHL